MDSLCLTSLPSSAVTKGLSGAVILALSVHLCSALWLCILNAPFSEDNRGQMNSPAVPGRLPLSCSLAVSAGHLESILEACKNAKPFESILGPK